VTKKKTDKPPRSGTPKREALSEQECVRLKGELN